VSPSWNLSQRAAVLIVGFFIFISYISVKNPDLFFFLTACFIPFAYIMSMITLLTLKSEWKNKQNIKTVLGLLTASAIFIFAVEGLIQEIVKLR
jgi:hypothetical protein